jgi:predicted protein tyrosine phosphatase
MSYLFITVMSHAEAQRITLNDTIWQISIDDSSKRVEDLRGYSRILRLPFKDVTEGHGAMDADHAMAIKRFVGAARDAGAQQLIIHCEAGVSRSAAVAAALAKLHQAWISWANRDATVFAADGGWVSRFKPNPHVYQMLTHEPLPGPDDKIRVWQCKLTDAQPCVFAFDDRKAMIDFIQDHLDDGDDDRELTISPAFMTRAELKALPEWDGI